MEFDLVLRHGSLIDGSGAPSRLATVCIKGYQIRKIIPEKEGAIEALKEAIRGEIELDVSGLVISPGFIDIHTHVDEIATIPSIPHYARMGVTTVVAGNCGESSITIAKVTSLSLLASLCGLLIFKRALKEGRELGPRVSSLEFRV